MSDPCTRGNDRYVDCQECGEPVDTQEPGHWKAPNDEQWWHADCYDKIEKAEELAKRIRALMVPNGEYDGYSDHFHDRLDDAQSELETAVQIERVKQEQDLVTDGGVDGSDSDLSCPVDGCENESLDETSDDPDHDYFCHWCGNLFESSEVDDGR